MSDKIELKNICVIRVPKGDRDGRLAYVATAIGPNGREFWTDLKVTQALVDDTDAFDSLVRASLQSTYEQHVHFLPSVSRALSGHA